MTIRLFLSLAVIVPFIAACTPTALTDGFSNLFAGNECTARVRQEAFDAGLNPAQAQARIRSQCG